MRTPAARALYLGLFGLGLLLYVVFVLPRWWVLTGDIPRTLATAGRIATGVPIALAAWPVMQLLKAGLRTTPRPPELALRLRAWSGMLHVIAGVLILLAAIAEIWLRLQVGGPWLFGVYGAAAAIAVLGALALYLSFVAAQPPAAPKPPKVKKAKVKKAKVKKAKAAGQGKRPTTKRGRKAAAPAPEVTDAGSAEVAETAEAVEAAGAVEGGVAETVETTETAETEVAVETEVAETVVVTETGSEATELVTTESESAGPLRNKRPAGKSRRRLGR